MPRGCRICRFFQKYPYKLSEKELFEKKCREGTSLRKLELLLEAYGLKAKKDLIAKHIKVCMNVQVAQQREIEKEIKKKGIRAVGQKLRQFFVKPELPKTLECEHLRTTQFFDMGREEVFIKCLDCGKILGSYDPEENERRMERDPRNVILYNALRKIENA